MLLEAMIGIVATCQMPPKTTNVPAYNVAEMVVKRVTTMQYTS